MIDVNEQAVNCIAQAIVDAFKMLSGTLDTDTSQFGIIKTVPDTGVIYTVSVKGGELSARPISTDTYNEGDKVIVFSVKGNTNNNYILGRG